MKIITNVLLRFLVIISGTLVAFSQVTGVVVAQSGIVVKNAPYSAESSSISIQTLFDGNKITSKFLSKVFRDSEGRTRTEQIMSEDEAKSSYSQMRETITISDPVAGFNYYLNPVAKTARKVELKPYKPFTSSGVIDAKAKTPDYKFSNSTLPETTIEGLLCTGMKTTNTTPAGAIGNEREIVMIMESWYSKDLKITVLSKTIDPRMGDRTTELKNIKQGEPDKSLFEVPKDYTITTTSKL